MLRQMVVASGKLTQESVLSYTQTMMDMYRNAYRAFSPPLTPFDVFPSMMANAGHGAKAKAATAPPTSAPPENEKPGSAQGDVDDLRRRIEELEKTLVQAESGSAAKRKRRKE